MDYLYIKALHIIFVVTWFAGLFYMMRLFIYHREAQDRPEAERNVLIAQYRIMEQRLWYIIAWPSAILTIIFGGWMFGIAFAKAVPVWLWVKLGFLVLLYGYHFMTHRMFVRAKTQDFRASSSQLRMLNELPTLFLLSIVFLAVTKSAARMGIGMVVLLGIMIAFMIIIRLYKRAREARKSDAKS